ncbi:MAG: hypothetical protein IPG73_04000 [Ignavibacteria bacterium]|nr:hypothetical protein [Ignavibacteria bacterium]
MISKVAYGLSLFLARGYDVKSTANLTALRNIVGAECDCESGYGFFTSANSSVGKHFLTCDEDLPRSLLALAGTDSSFFCKTLTRELNKVCSTLDLKEYCVFHSIGQEFGGVCAHAAPRLHVCAPLLGHVVQSMQVQSR